MAKLVVDFFAKCCLFLSVTFRIGQNLLTIRGAGGKLYPRKRGLAPLSSLDPC